MSAQGFETKILAPGDFPSFDPPDYWWQASDASCAFQIYRYRHHQHSNWRGDFTGKWNQLNPWVSFKFCWHPFTNNRIFWQNPAEPPATANIYSFLITFNIHTLCLNIHICFLCHVWHHVSQQFVCVFFFVANESCFFGISFRNFGPFCLYLAAYLTLLPTSLWGLQRFFF